MRRSPLRRQGRVAERTEARRQEFLGVVFAQSPQRSHGEMVVAHTSCGAAVGADGKVYHHPIGSKVVLPIFRSPAGRYITGIQVGHVHHLSGRNHGGREDIGNMVLLSRRRHGEITAYEKGTGKRWAEGCGA